MQTIPVLVVILLGGLTTNLIWCVILNIKNNTGSDYLNARMPLMNNYFFSGLAGITWYLQYVFYGIGYTMMGAYNFSNWTLHMSFIILVSNFWGIYTGEWNGFSPKTMRKLYLGISVIIIATIIVGVGNYLAAR